MRWLIWTPRALYLVSGLAFGLSAVVAAPAWGIAVQAFAWAALIQIALAIYSEVLLIREALERQAGRQVEQQALKEESHESIGPTHR